MHLCAYCMRRIPDKRISDEDKDLSDVYIEHWQTRGKHKKRFFTCDKKGEMRPLKINPLDMRTLETIYYFSDGTMKSTDKKIDNDINIKLNLKCNKRSEKIVKLC